MRLPTTPIYVREGFALLTAASCARLLAASYIADQERERAVPHKKRARFWIDLSSRRPGPRLP